MVRVSIANPRPTLKLLEKYTKIASYENSRLILFPEAYLSVDGKRISLEDKRVLDLCRLSEEYNIAIATGLLEKKNRKTYNSLILVDRGELKAVHRKVILFPYGEEGIERGDKNSFPVTEVEGLGVVGLSLCYEALFPETFRLLRYRGAEIVLNPSGYGMKVDKPFRCDYYNEWLEMLKCRARENYLYVLSSSNAIGENLMGVILSPLGEIQIELKREGVATGEIDLEGLRNLRRKLHRSPKDLRIDIKALPKWIYKFLETESQNL